MTGWYLPDIDYEETFTLRETFGKRPARYLRG